MPVKRDLIAQVMDDGQRLTSALLQRLSHARTKLSGLARGLGQPQRLLDVRRQRLDHAGLRLDHGLTKWIAQKGLRLEGVAARLRPHMLEGRLREKKQKLTGLAALLESLSFERVLERGYAVVYDDQGHIISSTSKAVGDMTLRLKDGKLPIKRADG